MGQASAGGGGTRLESARPGLEQALSFVGRMRRGRQGTVPGHSFAGDGRPAWSRCRSADSSREHGRPLGGNQKMNPIVFIVGCPRSGTTWLQRLVDAHPRIAIVPEVEWISRRYENREGLTPDGLVTPRLAEGLRSFGRYASLPMSQEELRDLLAQEPPISYSRFVTLLFDRCGKARGKELVGNKTVDHARNIGTLHHLWPEAKFIHLIRDGRDVCLSALSWRRADKLASRFSTWRRDPVSTAA